MNREIKFGDDARRLIQDGIKEVTDAIKVTLGPRGKNVIIRNDNGKSIITKDGITVASAIDFDDEYKSIGVELIRDISESANDISGDGSSTSAIIGAEIINEGLNLLKSGHNPIDVKEGIENAIKETIENLKIQVREIKGQPDRVLEVAMISTNGDAELSELVASVQNKVGLDGIVSVEKAPGFTTYTSIEEGFTYDQGYMADDFINNNGAMTVEYDNPIIFIADELIKNWGDVLPIVNYAAQEKRPLVLLGDDIHDNVIEMLVVNKLHGLDVVALKTPGFESYSTPMAGDLAKFVGAHVLNIKDGMQFTPDMLGSAKKIIIKRESTTIIGGAGNKDEVTILIKDLKEQLTLDTVSDFDKDIIKERIARLKGVVAEIKVGGQTDIERKERRDRVHDALGATRSAMEGGIIPGGGIALLKASKTIDLDIIKNKDTKLGAEIVKNAMLAPFKQIVKNSETGDDKAILDKVYNNKKDFGFNAKTREFCYMFDAGIIDPFKVTMIALEKASSIASLFLMTDCVITNKSSSYNNSTL